VAIRECARCHRVLVHEDDQGWYYQAPVTDPEVPGLVFMDRVHECEDDQPHDPRPRVIAAEREQEMGSE
jgi:hypothetical protein